MGPYRGYIGIMEIPSTFWGLYILSGQVLTENGFKVAVAVEELLAVSGLGFRVRSVCVLGGGGFSGWSAGLPGF